MLRVTKLRVAYGPVVAVQEVSIEVPDGRVVVLLGPNGAGKTTILHAISGLIPVLEGTIEFDGRRLDGLTPDSRVRCGVAQVPQGRQIFPEMTVLDNLQMGAFTRRHAPGIDDDLGRVFAYFPILAERRAQWAGTLSGGEQQMLAIGRALMARPRVLLMDEPSLGLAPLVVREMFRIIGALNREGLAILLAEQNVNMALVVAASGYVLESGRVVLEGSNEVLRSRERLMDAYLGKARAIEGTESGRRG